MAALLCSPLSSAHAQVYLGREFPQAGSVEAGAGGAWTQGFDLTSSDADLTRSGGTNPFTLFSADGSVGAFPGAYAKVGVYLSRAIAVEAGLRYAKPTLSYDLSGDAESADDVTASETVSHYVFDGSVLFHFTDASFAGGRGVPFVSAGGGYIRELHEGDELVETGNEIHATLGVKYWFGAARRRMGLRVEAGVSSRAGGFDGDERRTLPVALGGLTFLF